MGKLKTILKKLILWLFPLKNINSIKDNEYDVYKRLEQSYIRDYSELGKDYFEVFKQIAIELNTIPIKNELIYVSHIDKTINFTLYLGKGLMLGIAKSIKKKDNIVMFSISLSKKVLIIDRMPLKLLLEKVKEIYNKIND